MVKGESNMAKKSLLLAIAILFIVVAAWKCENPSNWHRPIKVDDISRIILWGSYNGVYRDATQQEVINIVNWFNSADDIRNANFVGTTEESGIKVELKNCDKFGIGRSGQDFEVQRKDAFGISRSYWARQNEIKELLDELAKNS
jgi:hypothetical protein